MASLDPAEVIRAMQEAGLAPATQAKGRQRLLQMIRQSPEWDRLTSEEQGRAMSSVMYGTGAVQAAPAAARTKQATRELSGGFPVEDMLSVLRNPQATAREKLMALTGGAMEPLTAASKAVAPPALYREMRSPWDVLPMTGAFNVPAAMGSDVGYAVSGTPMGEAIGGLAGGVLGAAPTLPFRAAQAVRAPAVAATGRALSLPTLLALLARLRGRPFAGQSPMTAGGPVSGAFREVGREMSSDPATTSGQAFARYLLGDEWTRLFGAPRRLALPPAGRGVPVGYPGRGPGAPPWPTGTTPAPVVTSPPGAIPMGPGSMRRSLRDILRDIEATE